MPLLTLTAAAAQIGLSAEGLRRILVSRPDVGRRIGGRWRVINGAGLAQLRQENK